MARVEFDFDQGDNAAWLAEPELSENRSRKLGDDSLNVENFLVGLRGWIGDAPYCVAATDMAKLAGSDGSAWSMSPRPEFADRYILSTFGVDRTGGVVEPSAVGLELLFRDNDRKLNRNQQIHINTVFPSARFIVVQSNKTSGEVNIHAKAEVSSPFEFIPDTDVESEPTLFKLGGSAGIGVGLNHERKVLLVSEVHSAIVEAMGEADTRAMWIFHKSHGPLIGKTHQTVVGLTLWELTAIDSIMKRVCF